MTELLVKYSVTDAKIAELKEQYQDVPTIATNRELSFLKKDITVIRTLRTSVESRRKELKADALEYGRKVDAEARRIIGQLVEIEQPMKDEQKRFEAKVKAEKEEKARIERERVEQIQERIRAYDGLLIACASDSSQEIENVLMGLDVPDDFDYQEFAEQHTKVLAETRIKLSELLEKTKVMEQERADLKERERLADIERKAAAEREKEAQAERDRLAKIEREKLEAERKAFMEEQRMARIVEDERIREIKAEHAKIEEEKRALQAEKDELLEKQIDEAFDEEEKEEEEKKKDELLEKLLEKEANKTEVTCPTCGWVFHI